MTAQCQHKAILYLRRTATGSVQVDPTRATEKQCTDCGTIWAKQWSWVRYVPATTKGEAPQQL